MDRRSTAGATAPLTAPRPLALWASGARTRTLPASVAPVLIGAVMAMADGVFHFWAAFAALLGAILIQIGANFANDYFDAKSGADGPDRLGPRRLTASGLVTPRAMLRATVFVFGLAVLVGLFLVARGGWPIVVVGVASIAAGLLYVGGPAPYGYRGMGDVFVLVFFGPVATAGTYYVQALGLDWRAVYAGLAPGLISAAILAVNNLRDIETDARAGKRTLAVMIGRRATRVQYALAVGLASVSPLGFWAAGAADGWMLAPLAVLPAAWPVLRVVATRTDGPGLNGALADTGRLLMLYAVLFCAAWLMGSA
jgi:1,4-dihydroxy-2-naphthoate octaprenyltransferase